MTQYTHSPLPLFLANVLIPRWLEIIDKCDALEVIQSYETEEISHWIVYGHYRPRPYEQNGTATLGSFMTEKEAQQFHDRLLSVFPHLIRSCVKPKTKTAPSRQALWPVMTETRGITGRLVELVS